MSFNNIPDEIIILANELFIKIQQHCPEIGIKIDNNGPQFSTNNIENQLETTNNIESFDLFSFEEITSDLLITPNISLEQLIEGSTLTEPIQQIPIIKESNPTVSDETWTSLEKDVIEVIKNALKDNQFAEQLPRLSTNEKSLEDYKELLKDSKYTTSSIYYEIGRTLSDLTNSYRSSRKQHSESRRLFEKKISNINTTSKHTLTLRLYQYFKGHEKILRYNRIDQYLTPGTIGKISQKSSDRLKDKIAQYFNFAEQNLNSEGPVV